MKKTSLFIAVMMLAGCSSMGMQGSSSGYGGSSGTGGTSRADADNNAAYATNPGMYRGDPADSLYFGD